LLPRFEPVAVITSRGLLSRMRLESDSAENPANTTELRGGGQGTGVA
jgi:hypothetical protein